MTERRLAAQSKCRPLTWNVKKDDVVVRDDRASVTSAMCDKNNVVIGDGDMCTATTAVTVDPAPVATLITAAAAAATATAAAATTTTTTATLPQVYSLGVVAWELMAGGRPRPFEGVDRFAHLTVPPGAIAPSWPDVHSPPAHRALVAPSG